MSRTPLRDRYPWAFEWAHTLGLSPDEATLSLLEWLKTSCEKSDVTARRLAMAEAQIASLEAAISKLEAERHTAQLPKPRVLFPGLFARLKEFRKSFS